MSESDPEIAPIASDASPSDNRESPAAGLNTPVVNEPAINPTADTSPPSAPGHAWVGKRIGDRYDIDRLIGQGGMGAVYKGRHIHMRKTVAIKVLLPEMTAHPEAVARFEREAIASARIAHHNVVAATDFGQLPDGSFFLVLDFVDGRSLSDTIHEEGILNPRRAIRIAEQVAAALEAAHQQNIFHRDLKPDNIMLIQKPESSELVKVLDFGIAKMETVGEEKNLTRAGVIFGTPQYMAPEQAAGQPVDGRSDLYALGIVLYEMLGGNAPFDSEELVAILTKQITQEPDPLPESIDPNIRKIVMKLLEKQPDARYQSATELLSVLRTMTARWTQHELGIGSTVAPPAHAEIVQKIKDSSEKGWDIAQDRAQNLWSKYRKWGDGIFEIGGRQLPKHAISVAGLSLLLGLTGILTLGGGDKSSTAGTPAKEESKSSILSLGKSWDEPELTLLESAENGDADSIGKLTEIAEDKRSPRTWLALGHGYYSKAQFALAAESFEKALNLDSELSRDNKLLGQVHKQAGSQMNYHIFQELAANHLGSDGADLLFDIWSIPKKTKATENAWKLVNLSQVREHYSPALKLAMSLREEGLQCPEVKDLLEEAIKTGDDRSALPLRKMQNPHGCGLYKAQDCFPCIREGALLERAIETVVPRSRPIFRSK